MGGRIYRLGLMVFDLDSSIAYYRDIHGLDFRKQMFIIDFK